MTLASELPRPGSSEVRFLHLVPDNKFIDDAVAIFEEALPGAHDYVFLGGMSPLVHLERCVPLQSTVHDATSSSWFGEISKYEAVFVHFLNQDAREFMDAAAPATRFVWLGWGGDYYHLMNCPDLLSPSTRALVDALPRIPMARNSIWRKFANFARSPIQKLRQDVLRRRTRRISKNGDQELALLNRFDCFAPVLEDEYHVIRTSHPEFEPKFASWNYWTRTKELVAEDNSAKAESNILLGNSATPENNHLDAFSLIASCSPLPGDVVCPLSYGNAAYAEAISEAGKKTFGTNFKPLRDFLKPEDYVNVLRSCDMAVMNHVRQQALGNIILMLWLGSHVFLNRSSPINAEMSRLGVKVHDIREIGDFMKQGHERITGEKLQDVRARLDARFGRDAVIGMTRALLRVRDSHQSESGL